MAQVRIECFRNNRWSVRAEGNASITVEQLAAQAPHYTLQYPHRFYLDDQLVVSSERRDGRAVVTTHEGK